MSDLDLFAFVHAGIRLALDARSVRIILRPRPLTAVPGAPAYLGRTFQEGGRIVPLADLSLLLGRSSCGLSNVRIVLVEGNGRWLGICTESALGPMRCDPSRLAPPASSPHPRIARSIRGVAADMTVVLDGATLVDALRD